VYLFVCFCCFPFFLLSFSITFFYPISETSGAITIIGNLDYETSQSYTLNVSVTDRGYPPLQSFALVYINIADINDNVPVFNESNAVVNVSEDVSVNHTIVVMKAVDSDSGYNGKVGIQN